jgi:membrane fusion protein, heavy metal efflux system
MFVTTRFTECSGNAILVPASSLYQMEETSFVFISLGNNKYTKRSVEVNGTDSNRVIIKAGLNPDDEIVIEGGSLLLDIKSRI